ncbi:hypothetical protein ACEN9X_09265 [Mucilaginibacter sp. Mucisp86]|uniref:hypothetical protein n=1 Tax=Mucilaginibacter sp. Mucisp86 TaxID=3243060 RepID=UPI0039B5CC96
MKFIDRITAVFEKIDNDELLLLKGHLLIEELILNRLSAEYDDKTVKALDLSFYKKLVLFAGITKKGMDSDLIKIIIKINQARNKLAHNLDIEIKPALIEIIRDVYGELPKTINRKTTYLNALKKIFYFILGRITGTVDAHLAFKETL